MEKAIIAAIAILGSSGCGSDDGSGHAEDPAEQACEQRDSAGQAVEAAATRDQAPDVALSDEPYTVSLPAGVTGYVQLTGPAAALLLVEAANVATGLFQEGSDENQLPEGAPNEFCEDDIPEHFDLDLEDGAYQLGLGPSALDEVWLMFVSAEGHAEHD